ncbi:hypothetical protein SSABA_v1c04180 [Spiroplasma sabaudiense Ar-1343]|uniref:GmrSD restriction endonucleases N-terminal domain-containing protein n=1 Tax=Spiroplasma sabaudiense Ar-1343 TaxID=1276257 RepID=W6A9W1_9MOLU|nr:DUF262 domain-containing protein [Spiroplasma sabaudiense]AHI53827.1 hypothetical protein SSABA_v1c04180 [Spiroplasma sabaudiense Ar-1343]
MKLENFYKLRIRDFISIEKKHDFFDKFGSAFEIPEFQRDYSWGNSQLEEFFDDIIEAKNKRDNPDFSCLGIIYLYYNKHSVSFEVIDGQQRLTSIILLVEVFRKILLEEEIKHSLFNKKTKRRIINGYSKDCVLEKKYVKFMDKYLNNEISDDEEIKSDDVCKKFLFTYNFFYSKINETHKTKQEKLELYEFILEKIFFIFYVERDNEVKYNLFIKLNSRGSELQFTTLLKSHLYSIDNFEVIDSETGEKFTRHFASKYENMETKWFCLISKLKNKEQKYSKIKEMCGFFAQNYGAYFYSKLSKPFLNEANDKKLFAKYREIVKHLFEEYKNELINKSISKNDYQIKQFFEKMDTYVRRFIKYCIEEEKDECIFMLKKMAIKKYLSLIIYMDIEYPKFSEEFKENVFMYCYLRKLKNLVENNRLPSGTKNEQISPRNLHFEESLKIIVSKSEDNCKKVIQLIQDKIEGENFGVFVSEFINKKDEIIDNEKLKKEFLVVDEYHEIFENLMKKYGLNLN